MQYFSRLLSSTVLQLFCFCNTFHIWQTAYWHIIIDVVQKNLPPVYCNKNTVYFWANLCEQGGIYPDQAGCLMHCTPYTPFTTHCNALYNAFHTIHCGPCFNQSAGQFGWSRQSTMHKLVKWRLLHPVRPIICRQHKYPDWAYFVCTLLGTYFVYTILDILCALCTQYHVCILHSAQCKAFQISHCKFCIKLIRVPGWTQARYILQIVSAERIKADPNSPFTVNQLPPRTQFNAKYRTLYFACFIRKWHTHISQSDRGWNSLFLNLSNGVSLSPH